MLRVSYFGAFAVRRLLPVAAAVGSALLVACSDSSTPSTSPDGRSLPGGPLGASTPGTCTTLSGLNSLAKAVFGSTGPNVNSVIGKLDNLDKQLKKGNLAAAQDQARNTVAFIQQKAAQGQLGGTRAQIQTLISGILCYSGLLSNTFLVYPTDQPQVITDQSGQAGVSLQGNTVGTPTLVTVQLLDPNGTSPLITKLDKYPGYVELTASSPLTKPAVVGVCPSASVPASVLARLRLGHQATTGFEITPPADASFLNCTAVAASKLPGWVRRLADLVMPKALYAATMDGGGVGGVATEFSPFGPVDPDLSFTGGVGGTSTEFMRTRDSAVTTLRQRRSQLPGATRSLGITTSAALASTCASVQGVVGTPLSVDCRPVVTITTFNGTILQNVPVSWEVTQGGGVIAPSDLTTSTCGTFGSTAANATDVNGKASVCWTLGSVAGTNTVVATPGAGGDAPAGVYFTPAKETFTATGTKITPTATATGVNTPYDGQPHAGNGTCSNGLTPALSYSSGGVPLNAGSYTLTVTCGGGATYDVVTATASIVITQVNASASAASATMLLNGAVPLLPCTVTGLLPAEAGLVTCTSSLPGTLAVGANPVTPVIKPANPPNYQMQSVNGVLSVLYQKDHCMGAPLSAALPPTSAGVVKGTALTVRCRLMDANFVVVSAASGSVVAQDLGTDGLASPTTVLNVPNAFTFVSPLYGYELHTSLPNFLAGHYYQVTATWDDGSTSVGYFYLTP